MRWVVCCAIGLFGIGLSGNLVADEDALAAATLTARKVAEKYLEQEGGEGAEFRSLYVDKLGQAHARYDQTYGGVPVFAGQVIVHVGLSEEKVIGVTDARRPVGPINIKPSIRAVTAERIVKRSEGLRGQLRATTNLVIYVTEGGSNLAWQVNLVGLDRDRLPVDWIALVDARDGSVLLSYNNVQSKQDDPPGSGDDDDPPGPGNDDDPPGSGDDDDPPGPGHDGDGDTGTTPAIGEADTLYFGTVGLATEAYEDGTFGMRDPTRGGNYTTDMLDMRTGDGELFIDGDNLWGDFTNLDRATAGTDAHFSASVAWDYYLNVHGRRGIYDDGKGILSRVHYGRDYVNAFWSSSCQCVTYGDGDGVIADPLVSIDIVAHEMTHGVTAATAALIYNGESGGLNESMSDIFATAAEFYAAGVSNTVGDYWCGEDVWTPGVAGDALRYMDDPTRDGRSIDHYDDYTANMDVHYSSGLTNHVFYLMSEGGPHASTGELVTGIGRDKAEQVFYRALAAYMTPDTDFAGAKEATKKAAMDLYGSDTAELVAQAWTACGVE